MKTASESSTEVVKIEEIEVKKANPSDIQLTAQEEADFDDLVDSWFVRLTAAEKRFHVCFYALGGLTGILLIQLIWQLATYSAK
jgi:hypothetical protein